MLLGRPTSSPIDENSVVAPCTTRKQAKQATRKRRVYELSCPLHSLSHSLLHVARMKRLPALVLSVCFFLPTLICSAPPSVNCTHLPFEMAEGKCDQGAAIVELFVFNSRSDTGPLRPLLELLLAASDWPIRLECGTEQLAIEAIFSDNGILPRPGVVITESHPVFIATRVAALRHSLPRQDWIGFAVVIPRIGVVRDCVATVFPGTVAEVVLDASCVQPHWGTELLSRSCESTTSIATSGLSDAAWRLEAALLETDASASHGSTRARSDRLMGVLLELHKSTAAAFPVTNNSRRTAASTTGETEGYSDEGPDRSHDQRILRKAFHRRIIRDLFPESASSLLEADGTTLRTDLRMDAAYAPVLLEAAVGHLTRGVPGLKWILEPVMYAVMKPVLNNFVNLVGYPGSCLRNRVPFILSSFASQ